MVAFLRMVTIPERMYTPFSSSTKSSTPAVLVMTQFLPMRAFLSMIALEMVDPAPMP